MARDPLHKLAAAGSILLTATRTQLVAMHRAQERLLASRGAVLGGARPPPPGPPPPPIDPSAPKIEPVDPRLRERVPLLGDLYAQAVTKTQGQAPPLLRRGPGELVRASQARFIHQSEAAMLRALEALRAAQDRALPIEHYSRLGRRAIASALDGLSLEQLQALHAHEQRSKGRVTVLQLLERRIHAAKRPR